MRIMKKNILVVDDSALMRKVICDIINSDSNFEATDICRDGLEAYERLKIKSYDGVILDVNMPRMDGLELLERLQKEHINANVIMVSTLTTKDAEETLLALERGAIDFITKPTNVIEAKGEDFKRRLLTVLNAVLATRLLKSTLPAKPKDGKPAVQSAVQSAVQPKAPSVRTPVSASISVTQKPVVPSNVVRLKSTKPNGNKLIALACSTGGPKALQSVIPFLPKNMDAPMVLVQHMPIGFTKTMADRLDEVSEVHVKEAEDGEVLEKGTVYVAPGGMHIEVRRNATGTHSIAFNDMPAIGGLKPCANVMYDSLSRSGYDEIICVVLTGMGGDGTNGILSLVKYKPLHIIAQNAETCVVYGMPKVIADTGLVDEVVPLEDVAKTIIKNVGVK